MADSEDDISTGSSVSTLTTPLVMNLVVAIFVVLLFATVSRRYTWCYQPRLARPSPKETRRTPPPLNLSAPCIWMRTLFELSEANLLDICSLDAVMFLRFFQLGLNFFLPVTAVGIVLLLPLNLVGDELRDGDDGYSSQFQLDQLTISNIRLGSSIFLVHVGCMYIAMIYLMRLLSTEYETYVRLRHMFYLTPSHTARPEQLSVMIQYIPVRYRTNETFQAYMKKLYPNSLQSCILVTIDSLLDDAVTDRLKAVDLLESAVATLHLSDNSVRPMCKRSIISKEKVDAIDHWSAEINRLNDFIHTLQQQTPSVDQFTSSGFATFKCLSGVSSASLIYQTTDPDELVTCLAPEPRDVYRPNLNTPLRAKQIRRLIVKVAVALLVIFWAIPVSFISALTTLENLSNTLPFLSDVSNWPSVITGFLQGFLPGLGLLIFQLLLPPLLLALSKQEGIESFSGLTQGVFRKFFLFQFFTFFLVTALSGSLIAEAEQLANEPTSLPSVLATGLAGQFTGFTGYILLQTLAVLPMRLLRLVPLVLGLIKLKYFVKTPHQAALATDPGPFAYGTNYPMQLFIFLLGTVYMILSPLILPFVLFFFLMGSIVFRFLLAYVHSQTFESGGRLFPLVFARIIVGALVAQLTLIGTLGAREAPIAVALMLPLPIITITFYLMTESKWGPVAERMCREEIIAIDEVPHLTTAVNTTAVIQISDAVSPYLPSCMSVVPVNASAVRNAVTAWLPSLKMLPLTPAVKGLVEIDVRSDIEIGHEDIRMEAEPNNAVYKS